MYLLRLAFRVVTQGYTPFSCVLLQMRNYAKKEFRLFENLLSYLHFISRTCSTSDVLLRLPRTYLGRHDHTNQYTKQDKPSPSTPYTNPQPTIEPPSLHSSTYSISPLTIMHLSSRLISLPVTEPRYISLPNHAHGETGPFATHHYTTIVVYFSTMDISAAMAKD